MPRDGKTRKDMTWRELQVAKKGEEIQIIGHDERGLDYSIRGVISNPAEEVYSNGRLRIWFETSDRQAFPFLVNRQPEPAIYLWVPVSYEVIFRGVSPERMEELRSDPNYSELRMER